MRQFFKTCVYFFFLTLSLSLYGDSLSLSANPSAFTINSATAGQQPNSVTNSSTTYSVTTLNTVRSINGKLSANMPTGVTLTVSLAAPTGATSLGAVSMTSVAQNLITGIPKNTTSTGKVVTYTLSATVNAAKVTNGTRTLTLTVQ